MAKSLRGKRNASPPSVGPDELLYATAVAHFAGIDVALRVHREIVQRAEFTSVAAVAGEAAERLAARLREIKAL
jgi:hypothetical protein